MKTGKLACCWVAAVACCLSGCTSSLQAPAGDLDDPATVHLVDHGRHPSLILPHPNEGAVRYAYGDWTWFAQGDTSFLAGTAALLWPTPGALGRQSMSRWQTTSALRQEIPEGFERVYRLDVSAPAASRLAERLDRLHAAGSGQALHNARFGLTFVPHPEAYWLPNNSNVVTARWLEELGVEVSGLALLSRWRVAADR